MNLDGLQSLDYPSWLYAVNLGATTIWERWNSLNPDGTISSTGMNSLNHYAYGSIVEWMYRDMCGLNPSSGDDLATGFRRARLAPKVHKALRWAKATNQSAAGLFEGGWRIGEKGNLSFEYVIPFNPYNYDDRSINVGRHRRSHSVRNGGYTLPVHDE